jgi:hypothetical protein
MDTEILQSSSATIPVRLLSATTFAPVTGVTAPTVYLHKIGGGAPAVKSIIFNTNWFEMDATHMPGYYNLVLSTTDTNTLGQICVDVKDSTSDHFVGLYLVVASTTNTVGTSLGTMNTNLGNYNNTLGTNTVNLGTYNTSLSTYNSTLGSVSSSMSTINSSISSINSSISGVNTEMTLLRKAAMNRTRIIPSTNTFVIYDDDGSTPVKIFSLYDQTSAPSSTNIFERVPQ